MEKIFLKLFWGAMLVTACLVLIGIWFGEGFPEQYFKTIATFLIFGIANFLVWGPLMAYKFLRREV